MFGLSTGCETVDDREYIYSGNTEEFQVIAGVRYTISVGSQYRGAAAAGRLAIEFPCIVEADARALSASFTLLLSLAVVLFVGL